MAQSDSRARSAIGARSKRASGSQVAQARRWIWMNLSSELPPDVGQWREFWKRSAAQGVVIPVGNAPSPLEQSAVELMQAARDAQATCDAARALTALPHAAEALRAPARTALARCPAPHDR